MKKTIFVLVAFLALSGCEEREETIDKYRKSFEMEMNDMIYAKDERTGICFARPWASYRMLTFVPCTERVLREIKSWRGEKND